MAPSPTFFLPHLLLSLLLLHSSSSQQQQQPSTLPPTEMSALLDIRRNLRDLPGSHFFSTWDFTSNNPCSSFAGIICSLDDDDDKFLRVSVLTLGTGLADSLGLTGTLPTSIANLTALTELVINPGRITGTIPLEIGLQCRRLRLISISNNLISGQIPISFAFLPDLHTLDLNHNQLQGPIPPPLLPSLPNLKVLILASNSLSGNLSVSISTTQLLHIDLRQNSFTGLLPPLPPTLRYLSVAANSMLGPLKAALSLPLPELTFLDLSMNCFTGEIPPAVFAMPQLTTILLQRNSLTGPLVLPPLASSWTVVDLSHNMITGEVPMGLVGAESLFLNNNKLMGPVPEEYARRVYAGSMTTLYAQHNFLTAFQYPPLPLPESVSLCLAYNCMVPPPSSDAGCPTSAGTQQSRPPEQCPNDG